MSTPALGTPPLQQAIMTSSLASSLTRRERSAATPESSPTPNPAPASSTPPASCYGYHNTFHTHALPIDPSAAPPSYHSIPHVKMPHPSKDVLPGYSCSVAFESAIGMKCEFRNLFEKTSGRDREWDDYWLVLTGTCLNIHRIKSESIFRSRRSQKQRPLAPGKLVRSYSLQHAEVGLALDFKRSELIPKSPLAKLIPVNARPAAWEADPDLFFPVRENVLRLRLETEQMLIACPDQETMLNWTEHLCAAVDISAPLEDRSEPRYRSLPRRGRRQRQLDSRVMPDARIDLNAQRLLADQERIIRTMYPNLAASREAQEVEQPAQGNENEDEYDANDMLFPGRPQTSREQTATDAASHEDVASDVAVVNGGEHNETQEITPTDSNTTNSTTDRNTKTQPAEPTAQSLLRYRRRCAPVLLHSSPRASDVILAISTEGTLQRYRVNMRKGVVSQFKELPPHYSAHHFSDAQIEAAKTANLRLKPIPRPTLGRGASEGSTRSSIEAEPELTEEEVSWGLTTIAELDCCSISASSSRAERRSEENDGSALGETSSLRQHESVDSEPPSPTTATAPQAVAGKTVRRSPSTINKLFAGKFSLTTNTSESRDFVL